MNESITVTYTILEGWKVTFYRDSVAVAVRPEHPPRIYPVNVLKAFHLRVELPGLRLTSREEEK